MIGVGVMPISPGEEGEHGANVPLPPSQKPWPFLAIKEAWQMPQSSGR